MANVDLEALQAQARSAYERGRWRLGLQAAWPALVMAGLCVALGGQLFATLGLGVVLAAVIAKATHSGRGASRAVIPGLLAGALPLAVGLIACRVPHACVAGFCVSWCAPLCLGAGGLAGVILGARATRAPAERQPSMFVGMTVAVLTGSLGCLVVGLGGVVGMLVGVSLGATAGLVPRLVR
jgi:hypothetical protein